ncbi:M24 family metallopeptidase [Mycobacterium vicinigordonae]|uniref:Aminopeptidase P family protein n=1 Tax=Mycobacterium vicinigordonae TaxID=1719132 RepID=A0A7D6HRH2_9MYCO|nr:M24 family metallopeptidase [Mycobacterium vicinigordonae]QLL05632.1 aminopeptidase P family protein [Mycobacterium vicinigordonae]
MSPAPRDPGVRLGMMSLEDGARVDFAWLRGERRLKVLSSMETQGLDALILGGVGNVHYVSGGRLLGRAGVLPFGPYAVVVRSSGRVHLLSTWDEGVPPEIEREDLYPLSWNPMNLMASLAAIPGLREAHRIGTDGMTPSFALLAAVLGVSEFVDAGPVLDVARRVKTAEEITCLTVAAAISESALSVMESALQPGITERELLARYYSAVAGLGVPVAPTESVCFATPLRGSVPFRHVPRDRGVREGELMVLAPGALYAGYEAGLACTRMVGGSRSVRSTALAGRCASGMDALLAACRPGAVGTDLYRAWERLGFGESSVLLAHGLGLGAEPPVIGLGRGRDAALEEGMVLSVQSWVTQAGVGGCLERATVLVTAGGAEVLTRYGRL